MRLREAEQLSMLRERGGEGELRRLGEAVAEGGGVACSSVGRRLLSGAAREAGAERVRSTVRGARADVRECGDHRGWRPMKRERRMRG